MCQYGDFQAIVFTDTFFFAYLAFFLTQFCTRLMVSGDIRSV